MNRQTTDLSATTQNPAPPTAREIAMLATQACPVIDTINIDKSTDVHIGPKIVSVVQNIDNGEKVKGRFMGLVLVSDLNRSRPLRCPVVVCLCWALVVCIALSSYLCYTLLYVRPTRLDIGINATWYIRRAEWQAIQPVGIEFLNLPVSYVIIGHSGSRYCNEKYQCAAEALTMQKDHIFRAFYDIGPNFLVGGNGYILEGRGANVFGAMLTKWNYKSISVMFFGNYGRFLCLVLVSKLNKSRRLGCSIAVFLCWAIIICLALAVYLIYTLFYVHPTRLDIGINATWYLRRADWQAIDAFGISFLHLPVSNVIIGQTGYDYCNDRYQCGYRALILQQSDVFQGLRDITPNFLVGGNGYILEGRGANIQGAMLDRWNYKSIGIMFFGDYQKDEVDDAQINNLKKILDRLVELNVLISDYNLYGICQLTNSTSLGPNLFNRLEEFSHWNQHNAAKCKTL